MKYLIANWKGFGTLQILDNFCEEFSNFEYDTTKVCFIFAPPVILLQYARINLPNHIYVASQYSSLNQTTGAITFDALSSINCQYTLCNHPELQSKTPYIMKSNNLDIRYIFYLNEYNVDTYFHIKASIFVYEPKNKSILIDNLPRPICFAGSVDANNAKHYLNKFDGLCIGKSSQNIKEIKSIIRLLES